jgi:competence protein ComEC
VQRAPLLVPAAAFVLGVLADAHDLTVVFGILLAGASLVRRDLAVACGAGFAGLAIGHFHGHPASIEHEYRTARYAGTVAGDVRTDGTSTDFPLTIDGWGTLRAAAHQPVRAGERIVVVGRIEPLDEPRNPGEPSGRVLAIDDGIVGALDVERVVSRAPPDLHDCRIWPAIVRERAAAIVRDAVPEPAATVLAGALWGERGALPQNVRDDFQVTGTVHVLVTAGLHLGVIAALAALLLDLLQCPRSVASLATVPIVYGYAWLSGWHLPSQRAAAMLSVALIARACGGRAFSANTLAFAAIVVAVCWPVAVQSISFALSFSCVSAIVLFGQPIADWFADRRVPSIVAEALALTISTQIGVWPLTAATFFTLAPYAVVANVVVVPLIGATMLFGLGVVVTHPLVPLAAVFARWDVWLLTLVLGATHMIAALPGARVTIAPPPIWSIVVYDAAVVAAAVLLRRDARATLLALAAACCVVVIAANVRPNGPFSIVVLDVGQGDGIMIRTPHGHTILIDTGGRLERGPTIDGQSPAERSAERIVIPYLRRAGITHIDLMVLTHPHGDHVGGAAPVLRVMPVGWVADSGQRYGGHAYNDALAEAQTHRVPVIVPACHQRWLDDEVTLTFLSPCGPQFADGANDVNENSLVVLVQYRNLRALFMGDAGFQSEERLLAQGVDLHADILKVGHHGSAYSSSAAFIDAVRPRLAIISVGRHNLFGHPAPVTLQTLRAAGASIFRTDSCGAVIVTARGTDALIADTMLTCALAPPPRRE